MLGFINELFQLLGEVFRTILIMSLSGSVLALILFALKPVFRHRLPKSVQYYLWLIVLVALIVPISRLVIMPATPSNITLAPVYTAVERISVAIEAEPIVLPVTNAESNITPGTAGITGQPQQQPQQQPPASTSTIENEQREQTAILPVEPQTRQAQNPVTIITTILLAVYPAVVLILILFNIISYISFTRKIRRSRTRARMDELYEHVGLCGDAIPPRLYRSTLAASPMLIGIFKPEVILPDREYDEAEIQSILQHEIVHLRRRDVVIKWLSVIACALHWFNPIVWLTRREIDRTCELSCDEAVIRKLNTDGRQSYGDTLISVASDTITSRAVLSTTMCEEKKKLKERLNSIMKYQQRTWITSLVSRGVIIVAICAVTLLGAGMIASLSDDAKQSGQVANESQSDTIAMPEVDGNEKDPLLYDQTIPDDLIIPDELIAQDDLMIPDELIVQDDLMNPDNPIDINGLIPANNKIYSLYGQTYFGSWEDLYRINISGNEMEFEHIFRANYGYLRGNGINNLMQCGDYLVFTQGSYIYKMHRATSEVTVLVSAENKNTCFAFDVKDDTIYFIGNDFNGGFTDDIYKIHISGSQPSRLNAVNADQMPFAIKIYSDWIFYMTEKGIYRIKIGEADIENILSTGFNYLGAGLVVSDGYIYYMVNTWSLDCVLYRMDINGGNRIELTQMCSDFIVIDDWIFYSEVERIPQDDYYTYHGKNIMRMRTDGTQREMIYEGLADIGGAGGDWIYYTVYDMTELRTYHYLIRLDGTGNTAITALKR